VTQGEAHQKLRYQMSYDLSFSTNYDMHLFSWINPTQIMIAKAVNKLQENSLTDLCLIGSKVTMCAIDRTKLIKNKDCNICICNVQVNVQRPYWLHISSCFCFCILVEKDCLVQLIGTLFWYYQQ